MFDIVGKLIAQGNAWDLLELAPREISFGRGVRRTLRETCLEFLVLLDNEPRYILVSGGFVIIPKVEPDEEEKTLNISVDTPIKVSDYVLSAKEN